MSVWVLLNDGKPEAAEARLRDAERWLDTAADPAIDATTSMYERSQTPTSKIGTAERVVVDEVQFRSLPAAIANARAYRAQALGDIPSAVTYTRQALDLLPEDDYYERGTTAALLGLAYWASGNLEAAHQSFADGLVSLQMGGGILIRIGGAFILADIQRAQGRLREAIRIYERSLQLATQHGEQRGTAELYLGLSELYCERGDLETARAHLLKGKALREQASLPGYEHMWCVVQARLKEAQGDLDSALDRLHEAERLYYTSPLPDVRPIAALKVRVWLKQSKQRQGWQRQGRQRQGRLAEALYWVRERGLSVNDDLSYLREYEHITLARILIAQYKHDRVDGVIHQAMGLLARLLKAAEIGERMGSVIEILVLQAIAHQAQGDIPSALVSLKRALTLAKPQGYVRIFVDEGIPIANLLSQLLSQLLSKTATQGTKPDDIGPDDIGLDYINQLLTASEAEVKRNKNNASLPTPSRVQSPIKPLIESAIESAIEPLAEPLSQRELEILRLIAKGLSNREIGDRLFLALNTVKGHNRRIFGKLEVQRRTEAVARARELRLL